VFRNRAVTDVFEPGSTVKPFTIAAALESGKFFPHTMIDTAPGLLTVGRSTIRDTHNYGQLTLAQVIEKSSNVGAARIALALSGRGLRDMFVKTGFGAITGVELPGEVTGRMNPPSGVPIELATLGYGYGISVTPLQLARAYSVLANGGRVLPVSLLRHDTLPDGERVMSEQTARQVRGMLEQAVSQDGTGVAAQSRITASVARPAPRTSW